MSADEPQAKPIVLDAHGAETWFQQWLSLGGSNGS
jgi:hypothetical protein